MRVFYLYWALFYDSKFTETTNTNRTENQEHKKEDEKCLIF